MQRHWARHGPPIHRTAALYLGLAKPPPPPGQALRAPEDLASFLKAMRR